jgi:hypothetical protein
MGNGTGLTVLPSISIFRSGMTALHSKASAKLPARIVGGRSR